MNTSFTKLDQLTSKFPEEGKAFEELNRIFLEEVCSSMSKEFTIKKLYDVLGVSSYLSLVEILATLTKDNLLTRTIRVISPSTDNEIGIFKSIEEIPTVLHDQSTDLDMEVTTKDLEIIYEINKDVVKNQKKA